MQSGRREHSNYLDDSIYSIDQPLVYKIDFLIAPPSQMTGSAQCPVTRGDQDPQFTGITTSINLGVMSRAGCVAIISGSLSSQGEVIVSSNNYHWLVRVYKPHLMLEAVEIRIDLWLFEWWITGNAGVVACFVCLGPTGQIRKNC